MSNRHTQYNLLGTIVQSLHELFASFVVFLLLFLCSNLSPPKRKKEKNNIKRGNRNHIFFLVNHSIYTVNHSQNLKWFFFSPETSVSILCSSFASSTHNSVLHILEENYLNSKKVFFCVIWRTFFSLFACIIIQFTSKNYSKGKKRIKKNKIQEIITFSSFVLLGFAAFEAAFLRF